VKRSIHLVHLYHKNISSPGYVFKEEEIIILYIGGNTMKRNHLAWKHLVVGIILLFVGTCIIPSIAESAPVQNDTTPMTMLAPKVPTAGTQKQSVKSPIVPSKSTRADTSGSWEQQAKLLASDGSAGDNFSSLGISVSGETALIGAWSDDDAGVNSGSAYVFTRTGATWTEQAKLLASDEAAQDAFGWCCDIEGDTALIGAAGDDLLKGSAYVFTRTGDTWAEQAKLIAADGAAGDQFGYCVHLSGDTAIIGANCDDDKGFDSGSAYVFVRTDTTWTQQTKLVAPDGASMDSFGGEVSISGDTILIGSCFDDDNGFDSGSAYVFVRTDATWTEQAKLLASDGAAEDFFSIYAVSISRDTALIGAAGDDDNGEVSGSAYVFIRNDTTWTEQAKLLASDGVAGDSFGGAVSISGDTALIGAGGGDDNGADSGSAYVFARTGTTWAQEAKLIASDGSDGDIFGWDVALDGDTALIGAEWDDDNGANSGSTYVFTNEGENQPPVAAFSWTPQNPTMHQPIAFDASASSDPDGTITTYEWDWNNDGVYEESHTTPTTIYTWLQPGAYPVTLKVTDDDAATTVITKTVNVNGTIAFSLDITGGFGVKAVIKNNGTLNATIINWKFTLTGGSILFGETKEGTILSLAVGAKVTVKDVPIIGFGKTTIKLDVSCAEGQSTTKSATGTVVLFFVLRVK